MTRIAVRSSLLSSIGYDALSRTLELELRSGGVYSYSDIPAALYEDLMRADSKGRYFNEHIKGQFPAVKVG